MSDRMGDRIKITGKGILGRGMHIEVNGQELLSCRRIYLEMSDDSFNTITLEIQPNEVDIDAEALAELVAIVDVKRKREHGTQ